MTAITTTHAAHTGSRMVPVIGGLFAMLSNWRDRRATRKALARLSDHELDDIGLTRADVYRLTE